MQALRESKLVRVIVAIVCAVYLFMPNFGLIELLPDNLPLIGNLDELAAGFLLATVLNIVPWVSDPSRLRWVMLGIIGIVSFIYLLNPTAGILELIPDNFPVIGNLDELIAAIGLSSVLAQTYYPRLEEAKRRQAALPPDITKG